MAEKRPDPRPSSDPDDPNYDPNVDPTYDPNNPNPHYPPGQGQPGHFGGGQPVSPDVEELPEE